MSLILAGYSGASKFAVWFLVGPRIGQRLGSSCRQRPQRAHLRGVQASRGCGARREGGPENDPAARFGRVGPYSGRRRHSARHAFSSAVRVEEAERGGDEHERNECGEGQPANHRPGQR